jgi:hypothetical protein
MEENRMSRAVSPLTATARRNPTPLADISDSRLLPALPALLPAPGSVLVVGADTELLAGELAAGGHTVFTARNLPATPPIPELSLDAVVLGAPDRGARPGLIQAARCLLREKGRLLIAGPAPDLTMKELVVALSEAGFVVLKEGPPPAVYLARKDSFFVREYKEGDEEKILPMFHRSFHVERSLERWRWEYRENPYGALKISEAFTEDGRLAAHYAGYPVRFYRDIDGTPRTSPALQVGDTMTEPAFRHVGRGPTSLLGRTVRHYYARFCEGQVAFNYGFNTGNIQRFSMSFVGARRLEDLPFHVLDLERWRPAPLHPLLTRLAGYRVERIVRFDARFDDLFRRVSPAYRLLVERDARYLEWRYARCPDAGYFLYAVFRRRRLTGWSIFRVKGERLLWGDALFDPRHPAAVRQLLAGVLAAPEHAHVKTVEAWITSRPAWWRERAVELGFESRPEPDDLGFVFVPFGHDPEEDFRAHLYYTMGDSDLF